MMLMTVALNKSGEVCWLNKSGGLSMEAGDVLECVRIAYERVQEWTKYIEQEVQKDEQKRNKDKRYVESTAENETVRSSCSTNLSVHTDYEISGVKI